MCDRGFIDTVFQVCQISYYLNVQTVLIEVRSMIDKLMQCSNIEIKIKIAYLSLGKGL